MDINRIVRVSEWLRNFWNRPGAINEPIINTSIINVKEALVYIEQSIHEDQPIIYRVLHEAGNNLFFERNINPYTVAVYMNPIAAGQILGLLDVLTGVHSNPKDDFWSCIHPLIIKASKALYDDGHYANAAEDAFIETNDRVKKLFQKIRPGDRVPDGETVMTTVFSVKKPIIELCDQSTETGFNTQKVFMEMLAGAMSALRNPKAHSNDIVLSKEEAMRRLMYASMLMYKIDEGIRFSGINE